MFMYVRQSALSSSKQSIILWVERFHSSDDRYEISNEQLLEMLHFKLK